MKFKRSIFLILAFIIIFGNTIYLEKNIATTYQEEYTIAETESNANSASETSETESNTSSEAETAKTKSSTSSATKTDEVEISSNAVMLMDYDTGLELFSKNADKKVYPASTTKILTAILAIENCDLEEIAVASYDAISIIPSGYSSAYLCEGEQMSIDNLLKALLVHSANDAANVIAEHVSESMEDFVALMNQKAQELGCKNTHFVNTNGIHDEDHYTTARDLAIITKYCLQNATFRKYIALKSCTIPATNKSDKREYTNTNDLINSSSSYYYKYCIGGKTGFTSQAQNCLISACNKNGLQLIAVVLRFTRKRC